MFLILFVCGTLFDFMLNMFLDFIDYRFRIVHSKKIPEELKDFVEEETMKKTLAYENANYFFSIPVTIINLALIFLLVFSGFFVWAYDFSFNLTGGNAYLTVLMFMIIQAIPSGIISIPVSLLEEFKIEKKFGFSNMTLKIFIVDFIKSLFLTLLLALPLTFAAVALITHVNHWWLLLGLVYLVFSLAVSYVYPVWISPMFNKFTELEDGELKTRLIALLDKCGFKSNGIFVMDASKRSSHSNAYFTGFGKNKRIVLYDTLLKQLDTDEIEAVLGHELGHFKHRHILKRMCFMVPLIFVFLFVAWYLIKIPSLYADFGFVLADKDGASIQSSLKVIGLFLLSLVFSGFSPLAGLVGNTCSRKDEFEADAFSAKICGSGKPLSSALIKLNKENLSEFEVPKIYSVFNYNHPPLLERLRAVKDK